MKTQIAPVKTELNLPAWTPEELLHYVEGIDIFNSALGNMSVVWSENGLDTRCVVISKEGEILREEFVMWEEMFFIPTAKQFAHLYECYPDVPFQMAFTNYRIED